MNLASFRQETQPTCSNIAQLSRPASANEIAELVRKQQELLIKTTNELREAFVRINALLREVVELKDVVNAHELALRELAKRLK